MNFCGCTAQFLSGLFGNPEEMFAHDMVHIIRYVFIYNHEQHLSISKANYSTKLQSNFLGILQREHFTKRSAKWTFATPSKELTSLLKKVPVYVFQFE